MGFRFRNRIKIAPGIYINLGKKGINSVSAGAGPFTSNFNRSGVKHTTGLHGSGLSYESKRQNYVKGSKKIFWILVVLLLLWVIF